MSNAEKQAKERHEKSVIHDVDKHHTSDEEHEDEALKLATQRLKEVTLNYSPVSRRSRSPFTVEVGTPKSGRSRSSERL